MAPLYLPVLLAVLSVLFAPQVVDRGSSEARVIEMPEPQDCGWFSGCHYERQVTQVHSKRGDYTLVTWQRVNN